MQYLSFRGFKKIKEDMALAGVNLIISVADAGIGKA